MFDYQKGIESFFEAVASGRRQEWIMSNYPWLADKGRYPKDADVVSEIVFMKLPTGNLMYQCEGCGRLIIWVEAESKYASFLPEDDYGHGIFSK